MASITTREITTGTGVTVSPTPLSNAQIDQNFVNLNEELVQKLPLSGGTLTGALTVGGNLTVNGTTFTINSTTVTVDDPIFSLGGDTVPVTDDNKDRGIEFRWHNGSVAKLGFFGFDDSTGKFTFVPDATNTSEVFSGTKGTIDANLEWADVLSKPNYVASVATTAPLSGGAAGSVGGALTLSLAAGYGDTQNPYASKTTSTFLAAPSSGNGAPSFRTIVASDIPTLNQSTTGNAATASTWQTARTITVGNTGKSVDGSAAVSWTLAEIGAYAATNPSGYQTAANINAYFGATSTGGTLDWNDVTNTKPGAYGTLLLGSATNGPGGGNYYHPFNLEYNSKDGTGNVTQMAVAYGTPANELYMRGRYAGSWTGWTRFLNSGNYNSYSPTLTGGGASGTWSISVTGNAATATTLQTARNINGVSFNGSANITVADSTKLPLTGGTLTGTLKVNTSGSSSSTSHVIVKRSGAADPATFSSYSGSWRSGIEIWNNDSTRMLFLNSPESDSLYANIKSVGGGFFIDVGSNGGTRAVQIESSGSANFPVGLSQGSNAVLTTGNYNSYSPTLTGTGASGTWGINITGNAATVTNGVYTTSNVMLLRSGITDSTYNSATTTGLYTVSYTGYSRNLMVWNTGGSTGIVQLDVNYGDQGEIRLRNATDSVTWSNWRIFLTNYNYNSYSPTLTGGGASGTWGINITGNAATATTLATARNINGTSFNGSANITTANWGTARTITIGNTGKSVNGSADVSWTLAEIGAQAAGSYLTSESDTLASVTGRGFITRASSGAFATNTQGTPGLEVYGAGTTEPAYMTFHRPSQYAVRFGLDGSDLKVGGWSLGSVGYVILHANNYNSYSPTLTGGGASGTWSINITGNAGGTASSISGYNNPTTAATANTIVYRDGSGHITGNYIFGSYFNAGSGNSENPTIGQVWTQNTSDNYLRKSTPAHFISQLALLTTSTGVTTTYNSSLNSDSRNSRGVTRLYRRDSDSDYSVQTYWTGSYWRLYGYNGDTGHADTHVGYADSAGSAGSVAWTNVSGRPTAVSSFSNDSGYITSGGRAYPRRSDGGDLNFYWSGQSGQPTWLWGGTDGVNMYVYNPSNFSVSYAATAGSAPANGGTSSAVTINYNNNSNSTYQMLWGSGNSVYGTAEIYCNPSSDYLYAGSFYCGNWFRSSGDTGWYSDSYGGGIYMVDTTWVRVYNSKAFYVANQIAATGNVTAYYSDQRLKTNLGNITGALNKITKLNGFRYQNNDVAKSYGYTSDKVQLGVSAQEVEELFPEVVSLAPFDMETHKETGEITSKSGENYKTVAYDKLVPVLIEALKECAVHLDQQEARINKLEDLVKSLLTKE